VYGAGVNHLILHVYIHQPDERAPGIIQWFGTAFNRHNTWFEQSKAFVDYTRRCSVMLKAGRPVADVAYYIGESAPMMEGPRQPELPDGYDFDYINSDVLIHRAKVERGRIILPGGASYAVLVLPPQRVMRPEVVEAVSRLAYAGATVIGPRPTSSPSLQNYPACDDQVCRLAGELWGEIDGESISERTVGKGRIADGLTLTQALGRRGVSRDVDVIGDGQLVCAAAGAGKIGVRDKGGIVYKHRSTPDSEVYFLANTSDKPANFTASLRVVGRKPTLWNAVTGTITDATAFTQQDGRTLIPLHLHASESIFVVFRESIDSSAQGAAASNEPHEAVVATLDGPWTVHFDGQGAPEDVVFDTLTDWAKHPNDAIKHYAGTGVYETSFTLTQPAQSKRTILELGEIGVIATAYVNGKEAGTVWTTPWEIDITPFVKPGKNDLSVRVANTWNNRLVADAARPNDQRQSRVSQPYRFKPQAPLLRGGLLGPVILKQLN